MINDIKRVLLSEDEISHRIFQMGIDINKDFDNEEELVIIGVLKGSFMFLSDLVRQINVNNKIDFIGASSYGDNTISSKEVKITKDINIDIKNKPVLIIEDIYDSGYTLNYIKEYLEKRNPKSISICVLLNKFIRKEVDIQLDYVGFTCPPEFIVGYGLDYAEKYRSLPFIGVLKEEVYK